jgi:hypothetical protein
MLQALELFYIGLLLRARIEEYAYGLGVGLFA